MLLWTGRASHISEKLRACLSATASRNITTALWDERRVKGNQFTDTYRSKENRALRKAPKLVGAQDARVVREIQGCTARRAWRDALNLLDSCDEPGETVYRATLNACAKSLQYHAAVALFDRMPSQARSVIAFNVMINLCARTKRVSEAENFFQRLSDGENELQPNVISYNSLITAYGMCGLWQKSLKLFEDMLGRGVLAHTVQEPRITFSVVMSACARAGRYLEAREIFMRMQGPEFGITPDAAHFNTLLVACVDAPDAVTARAVAEMMRAQKLALRIEDYNVLLSAHRYDLVECDRLLARLRSEGLRPDTDTYNALLQACTQRGDFHGFDRVLGDMDRESVPRNSVTGRREREMQRRREKDL